MKINRDSAIVHFALLVNCPNSPHFTMDLNHDDCMDDKHGKRTQQVQEGASIFLSLTCGCFLVLAVVILFEIFVFDSIEQKNPLHHSFQNIGSTDPKIESLHADMNKKNIGNRPRLRRPLKTGKLGKMQESNKTAEEDDMIPSNRYEHSRVKPGLASLLVQD
jgi:hypothetical protein